MLYVIDLWAMVESATEKNLVAKANRIEGISAAKGSKLTINLNNGVSRRFTMKI